MSHLNIHTAAGKQPQEPTSRPGDFPLNHISAGHLQSSLCIPDLGGSRSQGSRKLLPPPAELPRIPSSHLQLATSHRKLACKGSMCKGSMFFPAPEDTGGFINCP